MIGQDYIANKVEADLFPQGEEANKNVVRRRRKGSLWRGGFLGSTIVTIVILSILLLKILNDTSGLVAEESEIPERELLLTFGEAQVIGAPNIVLATEQDLELAAGVAEDPNGLGFVPWSAYLSQADNVRLLAVDGVQPVADHRERQRSEARARRFAAKARRRSPTRGRWRSHRSRRRSSSLPAHRWPASPSSQIV